MHPTEAATKKVEPEHRCGSARSFGVVAVIDKEKPRTPSKVSDC